MSIYTNISKGIIATGKGEVRSGCQISLTTEEIEDYGLQAYIGKYLEEQKLPQPVQPIIVPVIEVPVVIQSPVIEEEEVGIIMDNEEAEKVKVISKQKITATLLKLKDMPWQKRVQFINEADLELVKAILPRLTGEAQKAAGARVNS